MHGGVGVYGITGHNYFVVVIFYLKKQDKKCYIIYHIFLNEINLNLICIKSVIKIGLFIN